MDERQSFYRTSYNDAQRNYHINMRDAFHRIQNGAYYSWENIQELVPAGENVEEYLKIFTEGYVTCELSHIIGNLFDMSFRYRSIPIQLCTFPTHASNSNCNTMFA